jgi:hypothetical protein
VFKATLTCHNMLRAAARGCSPLLNEQVPWMKRPEWKPINEEERKLVKGRPTDNFGRELRPWFFKDTLQPIRGGNDEEGAWYHLFGVATMAMAGGKGIADLAALGEEYVISKDVYEDTLELYCDRLGSEMGSIISEMGSAKDSPY